MSAAANRGGRGHFRALAKALGILLPFFFADLEAPGFAEFKLQTPAVLRVVRGSHAEGMETFV